MLLRQSKKPEKSSPFTPSFYFKVNSFGSVPFVISNLVKLVAEVV